MVYASTASNQVDNAAGNVQVDVGRILMQSRKNNPKIEVGGVLYFSNNYFFQCLEGEQAVVNQLYQKISTDPRHYNIQTLTVKHIKHRQFADWSMKYVASKDRVSQVLKKFGMAEFNPYEFDDGMIEEVLSLFINETDNTSAPDQNYSNQVKPATEKKKGFFAKLFG
jgi:hypothetical protein